MEASRDKTVALRTVSKFVETKAGYADQFIETNPDRIRECIHFSEALYPDVVIVVCGHNSVLYVSENSKELIGYTSPFYKSLTLEESIQLIHPDDVNNFQRCIERMIKIQGNKYGLYRFSLAYRMQHPAGGYSFINDEKFALETSDHKYVFLTLYKNITREEKFSGVKMIVQKKIRKQFVTINEFMPDADKLEISQRERDIIRLIARGMSDKEIADELSISINTVKSHKQNLFKKADVKKSMALVNRFAHSL